MKVLITAGPTIEPIDPVRYLTNRSSGKMGYALAGAAAKRGHAVLLVSGPTNLNIPDGVDFLPVESAEDMYQAVASFIERCDLAIFAAAVADYTASKFADQKIKKTGDEMILTLKRTKDILGSARKEMNFKGTLVGFAAETENVEENARRKCLTKDCDLVIANDVSNKEIGFDSKDNEVTLIYPTRSEPLPRASKENLAMELIEVCEALAETAQDSQAVASP
ncbi:MAG: phosphopantothenoylcysteine decarboxylase [Verrucomicrobiota bacterium]